MKKTTNGFTVVELLIVIVVIGILAAITIVAYNGIQTRAENTKTTNSVAAYTKALNLYAVNTGLYPYLSHPCLGNVSPCGNVTDSTGACNGWGTSTVNASFNTAISTVSPSMPDASSQSMDCNGKLYAGAFYYASNGGKNGSIGYFLKGNTDCQPPGGSRLTSRYQNADTTLCNVTLATLP